MRLTLYLALIGLSGCSGYQEYKAALLGPQSTPQPYISTPAPNRVQCNINTELAQLEQTLLRHKIRE